MALNTFSPFPQAPAGGCPDGRRDLWRDPYSSSSTQGHPKKTLTCSGVIEANSRE